MRKEQWINIRGLAILSVIIIHTTTMRFNSSGSCIFHVLRIWFRFKTYDRN